MKIVEDEFMTLETIIRKATLESKIFRGKAKVMREAMLKISTLRDLFVFDEKFLMEENKE